MIIFFIKMKDGIFLGITSFPIYVVNFVRGKLIIVLLYIWLKKTDGSRLEFFSIINGCLLVTLS